MMKPAPADDTLGHVYVFEIIDSATPDGVQFKVGSSKNICKRLEEWQKQCPSKKMVFRGSWPPTTTGSGEDDSRHVDGTISLLTGKIKPGKAVKYHKRIEGEGHGSANMAALTGSYLELVHTELEGIAAGSLHLSPEFMDLTETSGQTTTSLKKPSKVKREKCSDCGKKHREIFPLARITSGKLKGKEWESVVKQIIEKWGSFVAEYV
ncbi:hypothetical protein FRC08_005490 [Ceratobasidium sp. 394]|nr:hypothetical protein FRC08_005490 [Ceratobasidium sp. 394]